MRACRAIILATTFAGLAYPSTQVDASYSDEAQPGMPGQCEDRAQNGGGAAGCYWDASINLGPMPGQVYWHIDRFPDAASAAAERTLQGSVTIALGNQVFLQTINDNPGWRPAAGERVATIGPLNVPTGPDLIARFMEGTATHAMATLPHSHSGPEAVYQLVGSVCVETPELNYAASPGESLVVPRGTFMQLRTRGGAVARSLLLVVHPADRAWIDKEPAWTPKGLC